MYLAYNIGETISPINAFDSFLCARDSHINIILFFLFLLLNMSLYFPNPNKQT